MVSGPKVKFSQYMFPRSRLLGRLTSSTLKLASLVELAGGRVDVATLGLGDANVVAGTGTANSYVGTRELVGNALIDTRLKGCEGDVSVLSYDVEDLVEIMDFISCYRLPSWFLEDLLLSLEVLPCLAA